MRRIEAGMAAAKGGVRKEGGREIEEENMSRKILQCPLQSPDLFTGILSILPCFSQGLTLSASKVYNHHENTAEDRDRLVLPYMVVGFPGVCSQISTTTCDDFLTLASLYNSWDQAHSSKPGCDLLPHAQEGRLRPSDMWPSGGAWGADKEKPKASKELMQIRFSQLRDFIQKWPRGTSKDGSTSLCHVILVPPNEYRFRSPQAHAASLDRNFVSALKEREEKKICDKLKQDLENSSYGKGMTEKEIPVIQIQPKADEKEEEAGAAEAADTAEKDAPASGQQ
eukprot:766243-Hanusia_phi.AAC.6